MRSLILALTVSQFGIPFSEIAAQAPKADVMEWTVPWERSRPRDPYVAPDGRVWFVGQVGNYLAVLDPVTGDFNRVEIDAGTHPHNQIMDGQGNVWYSGNQNGMIGRYNPATNQFTRYPMPDSTVRDPHTLIFDGKGNIYFTAQSAGVVGRLVMATGKIDLVPVGPRTRPYGIIADAQGRAWFTEFGTNIVTMIEPGTLALKRYTLPDGARPRRIALGPDGTIWYVDFARGFLGKLDPQTAKVTEWASPSGAGANPYAMASDDAGRLWYVETGPRPNRLVGFDPATSNFIVNQPVGVDGANTIRHMVFHAPTRTIWYGSDANMIGRVAVPPATQRLVP
jgi:virginiamycin B lyase